MVQARGRKKREMRGNVWDRDKEGGLSGLGVQLGADVTAIRRYRKDPATVFLRRCSCEPETSTNQMYGENY